MSEGKLIFLNHNELIKKNYKKCTDTDTDKKQTFSFRNEIFHFKRKILQPEKEIENSIVKSKKKKNKNRKNNEISVGMSSEIICRHQTEIVYLKNIFQHFSEITKISVSFAGLNQCEETSTNIEDPNSLQAVQISKNCKEILNLDEILNETQSFPKFKGENLTKSFQTIYLNAKTYLIPPNCKFYNNDVKELNDLKDLVGKYDFIILDPPWRNKFIRRLKKSQYKNSSAYEMMSTDEIKKLPIDRLIHDKTLVAIWCTNSRQQQDSILNEFFPYWKLKLIAKMFWIKITVEGEPICEFNEEFGRKQPYETLFIACPLEYSFSGAKEINEKCIISIPSLIHSHKPPIVHIFQEYLNIHNPDLKCLEIFARYLQPNFTSIGLEVLKLMDQRLYQTSP